MQTTILSLFLSTGITALVQCWFLIGFCGIKSKKSYYVIYLCLSYVICVFAIWGTVYIPPMLDTFLGMALLFILLNKGLRQPLTVSGLTATLTVAVTTLGESLMFLLDSLVIQRDSAAQLLALAHTFLFPLVILGIYKFFVHRYRVKSQYHSHYLLAFSLPIFFISVILRMVNYMRYSVTTDGIILQSGKIGTYEMVLLMGIAFSCICIILFAYEKVIKQMEDEQQKIMLHAQITALEHYVAEAQQKYETTKIFRHDFKNHLIALGGLIKQGHVEQAQAYMDRFYQIHQEITFPIDTGNKVLDTLLGEKLTFAEQLGIHVTCDVTVPKTVTIDDFDLCAIFANAIDNAIKGCGSVENKQKRLDLMAKPNKNFFLIDMTNNYEKGHVPEGSGIGLTTIQTVAEKYHGAVEVSEEDTLFRITILLPFDVC